MKKNKNDKIAQKEEKIRQMYIDKFFNLWMNKFEWSGLDEEVKEQQENYIMRKFWSDGTLASRPIKNTNMLVYCPYGKGKFNIYDFLETIYLNNTRGVKFIPTTEQVVNKDAVILWCQPNHKPIRNVLNYYIDKLTQVQLILEQNLELQKIPFIVGVTEEDKSRMKDVVDKILNNEPVVYTSLADLERVKALVTNAPYIVDKLKAYQNCIYNEALSFLGYDNEGQSTIKMAQQTVDTVNAGNQEINAFQDCIADEITRGLERLNSTFNRNISIKSKQVIVDSIHDFESPEIEEQKEASENE